MFYAESKIQQAIVKFAKLCKIDVFSIPNGADVQASNRIRLTKEGLLPGVPDLFFPIASKTFFGLFMEVKSEKGRVSPKQKKIMNKLSWNGYKCVVVYSLDDAIKELKEYLGEDLVEV